MSHCVKRKVVTVVVALPNPPFGRHPFENVGVPATSRYFEMTPAQPEIGPFPCKETVWFLKYSNPASTRVPLPANVLIVVDGVALPLLSVEVVGVALGSWMKSKHDPVQPVPQAVPGAHRLTLPLAMATRAYVFADVPAPWVK